MGKVRVLVVDDAAVVRRLLTEALSGDPEIEVVASASNGREALARVAETAPDLIVLDLEMPELDGLGTLTELRRTHPRLPVIMFSSQTERGAVATLEALACGASDYVTKPAHLGGVSQAQERIREELIPRIRALTGRGFAPARPGPPPATVASAGPPARPPLPGRVDVVAIGVSTGGPNALADILPALPADFPVPIVVVQHMPPVFTRFLAERLGALSSVPVREGVEGAPLEPGVAWVAPGNHHMVLRREGSQVRLHLHQEAAENSCRPAVDPLFRSAATVFGCRTLAVVLTGMGHDGLRGAEEVRRAGGEVVVQDEATSVVWGMPGAVAGAGLANRVVPLGDVAAVLVRRVAIGRAGRPPAGGASSRSREEATRARSG